MKKFLYLKIHKIKNGLKDLTLLKKIRLIFFGSIAFFLLLFVFGTIWRSFVYLDKVPLIGPLLINKILELAFLLIFGLLFFSALFNALGILYNAPDLEWWLSHPVNLAEIFWIKFLDVVWASSGTLIVTILPMVLAIGVARRANVSFYFWALVAFIPYILVAIMLAVLVAIILVYLFPRARLRDIVVLVLAFFGTGIYGLLRMLSVEKLVRPDNLNVVIQYLNYLNSPVAVYLPSWWLREFLLGLLQKYFDWSVFVLLFGTVLVLAIILNGVASRIYQPTLDNVLMTSAQPGRVRKNCGFPTRTVALFIKKDILHYRRQMEQWSQLLIIFGLVVVYLLSIYKLVLDTIYLKLAVTFFNIGLLNFIVAGLALRFVFPYFSRQGRGLALILSWPIKRSVLLTANLYFAGVVVWVMAILLAVVSNYYLVGPAFWIFTSLSAFLSLVIIILAAVLGIFYPQFNYQSILEIEGSAGAIFFMVVALFYLAFNLGLLAIPFRDFYLFLLSQGAGPKNIGFLLGSWLVAGLNRWTGWFLIGWFGLQFIFSGWLLHQAQQRLLAYEV